MIGLGVGPRGSARQGQPGPERQVERSWIYGATGTRAGTCERGSHRLSIRRRDGHDKRPQIVSGGGGLCLSGMERWTTRILVQ